MFNAEYFYQRFKQRVTEEKYGSVYRDNTRFTAAVMAEINEIICEMGFTVQNEYFRIDAIGWNSKWDQIRDEAGALGLNPHLWDLGIAVEHENDRADWTDELIKLVHIRCPIKVVIGYNHCDCRNELEERKLEYAAKWMQCISAFDSSAQEEYLIIMGNCAPKKEKAHDNISFDYRGYRFDYRKKQFILGFN